MKYYIALPQPFGGKVDHYTYYVPKDLMGNPLLEYDYDTLDEAKNKVSTICEMVKGYADKYFDYIEVNDYNMSKEEERLCKTILDNYMDHVFASDDLDKFSTKKKLTDYLMDKQCGLVIVKVDDD